MIFFLQDYLAERSYIEGYEPSQADLIVLNALKTGQTIHPRSYPPNTSRWYRQITSYSAEEQKKFPNKELSSEVLKGLKIQEEKPVVKPDNDDDEAVDFFASDDDESEEVERIKQERLKAYEAKKSKKPTVIAKSNIILDVKPWDDETDMKVMEQQVRTIEMDGLIWGASKLVAIGYGIHKLQIVCVVEDEKVSVDDLVEKIQEFEDYVQSVDIAAFNKI